MVGADGGGLERTQKRTLPESVVASKWRDEVFEPTVAAVPDELWGRLPAAEIFHQVLEHRWFLSEKAKKDIGIEKAVRSYVMSELPTRPPERIVLPAPLFVSDRAGRRGVDEVEPTRIDRKADRLAFAHAR